MVRILNFERFFYRIFCSVYVNQPLGDEEKSYLALILEGRVSRDCEAQN